MSLASSPSWCGFLAVVVAIVGFGTQGVFVKSNRIRAASIHPFLVVFLFSCCIAFIGTALGVVGGLSVTPFGTPFWHVAGWDRAVWTACAYAPGNVLLLWACRRIGVGLAVGLTSASTTAVSFGVGAAIGMDEGGNLTQQVPGIFMLLLAAFTMSLTRVPAFVNWLSKLGGPSSSALSEPSFVEPLCNDDDDNDDDDNNTHGLPGIFYSPTVQVVPGRRRMKAQGKLRQRTIRSTLSDFRRSKDATTTPTQSPSRSAPRRHSAHDTRRSDFDADAGDDSDDSDSDDAHDGPGEDYSSDDDGDDNPFGIRDTRTLRASDHLFSLADRYTTLHKDEEHLAGLDLVGAGTAVASGVFLGVQGVLWGLCIDSRQHLGESDDDSGGDGGDDSLGGESFMMGVGNALAVFMVAQCVVTSLVLAPVAATIALSTTEEEEEEEEEARGEAPRSASSRLCEALRALVSSGDVAMTLPYAFGGAVCFCAAVTGQVISVVLLPEAIAMPLTQLNLIVASLWGIAYYGELDETRLIAVFGVAVVMALGGAVLLAGV